MSDETRVTRRALIAGAAVAAGGVLLEKLPLGAQGTQPPATVPDPATVPGLGTTPTSARSPFETPARTPAGIITGPAYSPIQDFTGTITPSDLVFENLGAARAKQGRADDALREFLEAIRLDPGQADAHYNVAVMLIERGRKDEAVEHLRQALQAKPDHPGALQAMNLVNAQPRR